MMATSMLGNPISRVQSFLNKFRRKRKLKKSNGCLNLSSPSENEDRRFELYSTIPKPNILPEPDQHQEEEIIVCIEGSDSPEPEMEEENGYASSDLFIQTLNYGRLETIIEQPEYELPHEVPPANGDLRHIIKDLSLPIQSRDAFRNRELFNPKTLTPEANTSRDPVDIPALADDDSTDDNDSDTYTKINNCKNSMNNSNLGMTQEKIIIKERLSNEITKSPTDGLKKQKVKRGILQALRNGEQELSRKKVRFVEYMKSPSKLIKGKDSTKDRNESRDYEGDWSKVSKSFNKKKKLMPHSKSDDAVSALLNSPIPDNLLLEQQWSFLAKEPEGNFVNSSDNLPEVWEHELQNRKAPIAKIESLTDLDCSPSPSFQSLCSLQFSNLSLSSELSKTALLEQAFKNNSSVDTEDYFNKANHSGRTSGSQDRGAASISPSKDNSIKTSSLISPSNSSYQLSPRNIPDCVPVAVSFTEKGLPIQMELEPEM